MGVDLDFPFYALWQSGKGKGPGVAEEGTAIKRLTSLGKVGKATYKNWEPLPNSLLNYLYT
jgi:hypothetical protein